MWAEVDPLSELSQQYPGQVGAVRYNSIITNVTNDDDSNWFWTMFIDVKINIVLIIALPGMMISSQGPSKWLQRFWTGQDWSGLAPPRSTSSPGPTGSLPSTRIIITKILYPDWNLHVAGIWKQKVHTAHLRVLQQIHGFEVVRHISSMVGTTTIEI